MKKKQTAPPRVGARFRDATQKLVCPSASWRRDPFSILSFPEAEEEEEEEKEKGFLNKSLRHPHARMLDEDILRRGGERYAGTFLQRYFLQSIEGSIFPFFFSFQRMRYLIREGTIVKKSCIHRLKRIWIFYVCI